MKKNESIGGRASVWQKDGFTFDMGPSWYLMPEVFTHFFQLLGERVEDHLALHKLSPSYRIFFSGKETPVDFFANMKLDEATFEQLEPGSTKALERYLQEAKEKYEISMSEFLYRNYDSLLDFASWRMLKDAPRLAITSSIDAYVKRFVQSVEIQKILQYPMVFLGGSPYNTPAIYSLMSHIDFAQGVFYPMGGLGKVPEALARIAQKHGATIHCNTPVANIITNNGKATGVRLQNGSTLEAEIVIANTDRAYTESKLLQKSQRTKTRVYAPSAYLLFLGIKGRLPTLQHHNLFFADNWKTHFSTIFDHPRWPADPSFYVCAPSITDPSVAPPDHENLFVLVPIAAGLEDGEASRKACRANILKQLNERCGISDIENRIVVEREFSVRDFASRYNSTNGSALGLAHTLFQTALWRPKNVSADVQGLYFVGADTTPGIGVPMCLISAELVYKRLIGDRSIGPLTEPLQPRR